jgi:hypothetical protein
MTSFGQWEFHVDRPATMDAHAREPRGGADSCTCNGCRNFVAAREKVFPTTFLKLLDSLGIDPLKDGEVYLLGRLAQVGFCYGGWFHFIGSLETTGDFSAVPVAPGFTVWLCRAGAPPIASLKGSSLVQVEFKADLVPWLLEEAAPE